MIKDRIKAMLGSFCCVMVVFSMFCCIGFQQDAKLIESRLEYLTPNYEASLTEQIGFSLVKYSPSSCLYEKLLFCYGLELNRFASYMLQLNTDPSLQEEILELVAEDQIELQKISSSENKWVKAYASTASTFNQLIELSPKQVISSETYSRVFDFYNQNIQKMRQEMQVYRIANIITFVLVSTVIAAVLWIITILIAFAIIIHNSKKKGS